MKSLYCLSYVFLLTVFLKTTYSKKPLRILPGKISLEIPFNVSYTLTMNLKESKNEIAGGEVVADDRNGILVVKPADKAEHTAIYKNKKYRAMFTVSLVQNATDKMFTYMGGFYLNGKEYNLMPSDYNEEALGDKVEEEWVVLINGKEYNLSKLKPLKKIKLKNDELIAIPGDNETYADIFKETRGEAEGKPQISNQWGGKQNLIMEILVIIDASTYKKFFKFTKNNHKRTVSHIKFYYTHIMNGVNDRYQRVKHSEFSWQSIVTAIYIARNEAEAPFTSASNVRNGNDIKPGKVLSEMDKWVKQKIKSRRINWPSFDLIVLFHDLSTPGILGLATFSSVCLGAPLGLIVNVGTFMTITTAAHEIAHIIGSKHDAVKECLPEHSFIMNPVSSGDNGKFKNEAIFSTCSANDFARHARNINKQNKNCLLNKPSHLLQPMNGKKNTKSLLGQLYNLRRQCVLVYGAGSSFCGKETSGDGMCKNIQCVIPEYNSCSTNRNSRAFDGTPCGNRMWCITGRCVADSKAPPFKVKKCPYGDVKGFLNNLSTEQLTCAIIRQKHPGFCRNSEYSSRCCKTCGALKDKLKSEPCTDKHESCSSYTAQNPTGCFYKDVMEKCCASCKW